MQTWPDPAFDHFNLNLTNNGGVVFYKELINQSNMITFTWQPRQGVCLSKTSINKP